MIRKFNEWDKYILEADETANPYEDIMYILSDWKEESEIIINLAKKYINKNKWELFLKELNDKVGRTKPDGPKI